LLLVGVPIASSGAIVRVLEEHFKNGVANLDQPHSCARLGLKARELTSVKDNVSNSELARKDDANTGTLRLSPGHEAANENAASEQSARLRRVATVVADFARGANIIDASGNSVDRAYFKSDSYAICRSGDEALVVHSDNEDIASKLALEKHARQSPAQVPCISLLRPR
jgi:hypothetical protein